MRVLHVITRLIVGGAQHNTVITAGRHRRDGIDAHIAHGPCLDPRHGDLAATADAAGVPRHPLRHMLREPAPLRDLLATLELLRLVRRGRFDVIHTHTSKAGFIGRLAARLAGHSVLVHTPHGHVFHSYYGPFTTRAYVLLERLGASWATRIVALTRTELEETVALGIGHRRQFSIVPSGIDLARFGAVPQTIAETRAELDVNDRQVLLACVGRLARVKGQDVLLRALPALLAACPGARLALVGDGDRREELERLAVTLGVADAIRWTGRVDDPERYLAAADLVVVPSRNEGMGRVIAEAMAAGRAIVASRVGGIPDLLADGETGRLVPKDDPAALGASLVALSLDPGERRRLGQAAANWVGPHLGEEAMAARLREVYESVIGAA